jgi:hypothetical protein
MAQTGLPFGARYVPPSAVRRRSHAVLRAASSIHLSDFTASPDGLENPAQVITPHERIATTPQLHRCPLDACIVRVRADERQELLGSTHVAHLASLRPQELRYQLAPQSPRLSLDPPRRFGGWRPVWSSI